MAVTATARRVVTDTKYPMVSIVYDVVCPVARASNSKCRVLTERDMMQKSKRSTLFIYAAKCDSDIYWCLKYTYINPIYS